MRSILFVLLFSLGAAGGIAADREAALSAPRTLDSISALPANATLSEFKKIVGALGMDVGSAVHSYYYRLDDRSVLHVLAELSEDKRIISITREQGDKNTLLFPKPSAKTEATAKADKVPEPTL